MKIFNRYGHETLCPMRSVFLKKILFKKAVFYLGLVTLFSILMTMHRAYIVFILIENLVVIRLAYRVMKCYGESYSLPFIFLKHLPIPVLCVDSKPNFQILFSNGSARLFFGYENTSLNTLSLQKLTPQYGRLLEILKLRKKHVNALKFPLKFLHKEGYLLASEVMIVPSGSREERILLYIWDIRRLWKREKRFKQKLQRTEKVSQAKSIFVSLVSHEFRTPMASIRAVSDLLMHYWENFSQEECKDYLKQIGSNIFQMSRMMDDILLLGRIQNGRLRFETSLIDPLELCHEAIQFVQVYGEKSRITMVISENFPTKCSIDSSLFRYILVNLLSNALKYSPQTEKIILTLGYDQDFLVLEVKDKGIGIPEKDRGKIFHLFHRGENVGSIKGIGVGMFMVKYCVSLHKGSIAFKSDTSAGTTFRVKLPADCQENKTD